MKLPTQLREDKGFVLVTVLMGIAVLAGIATALTVSSRTNMLFTTTYAELARAEAAADAGVAIATLRILKDPHSAANPNLDFVCRFEDSTLAITIEDEGGKVDLNAASPKLIQGLLAGILLDDRRAADIADLIADFVDEDDEDRITRRSEFERYATIKGPTPKNSWFATIDELEQVAGLTQTFMGDRSLFEHLRPFVTVWSRRTGIDQSRAPRELLQLLEKAQGILGPEASLATEARFFTIRSRAITESGARFSREVTVERDPGVRNGYRIRSFLSRPFDDSHDRLGSSKRSAEIECSAKLTG
jgi:general secretion pathway protein K